MNFITRIIAVSLLLIALGAEPCMAETFSERFGKGGSSFGVQGGFGYTVDLPSGDRPDISFLFLFPNYQYNIFGVVGDSWYQGALYWHVEAGGAYALNHDEKFLVGFSPIMAEYKFLSPKRNWAPTLLMGAGFSYTNWKDIAVDELGSEFQFLVNTGAGLEFFRDQGSFSINYRLFHISNSNIESPNVGLNAHVFSLGIRF
jgi:hypothetical protein